MDLIEGWVRKRMEKKGLLTNDNKEIQAVREDLQKIQEMALQLEEREKQLQEYYELMNIENNILAKIAEGEPLYTVSRLIVDSLERMFPDTYCSILIHKGGFLWDYCSPSLPQSYLKNLANGFPVGPFNGSCGTAAFNKKPYIAEDIARDPNWTMFPSVVDSAREFGVIFCASAPIIGDAVLGTVAIYGTSTLENSNHVSYVLEWFTRLASIAIQRDTTLIELHDSNMKLHSILDSNTDFVNRADLTGRITYLNATYMKVLGVTQAQVDAGEVTYDNITNPEDAGPLFNAMVNVMKPPYRANVNTRVKTVSGERWTQWEGTLLFDKNGTPTGIQASGRDIHEKKLVEAKLEETLNNLTESNGLLNSVLDSTPDMICRANLEGVVTYANRSYKNILGISCGDVESGKIKILNGVYEEDLEKVIDLLVDAMMEPRDGDLRTSSHRCKTKDGIRWFEWYGYFTKNASNEITGIQCIGRDIHEKVMLEANLSLALKKIEGVSKTSLDAIALMDKYGVCTFWNPIAELISGYSKEEALGRKMMEHLFSKDLCSTIKESFKEFHKNKKTMLIEKEVYLTRKDSKLVPVSLAISTIESDPDYHIICICRDISQIKEAEAKIVDLATIHKKRSELLEAIIDAAGGFLWYKDSEHKYEFCDKTFRKVFFDLEECLIGLSDIELLEIFRVNGRPHEFGDLCVGTDVHSRDQGVQSRYLEGGKINGEWFVLEVLKTPIFKDGKYVGNIGFGWDRTADLKKLEIDIAQLQSEGRLEKLSEKSFPDSPFVYWIKDQKPQFLP